MVLCSNSSAILLHVRSRSSYHDGIAQQHSFHNIAPAYAYAFVHLFLSKTIVFAIICTDEALIKSSLHAPKSGLFPTVYSELLWELETHIKTVPVVGNGAQNMSYRNRAGGGGGYLQTSW